MSGPVIFYKGQMVAGGGTGGTPIAPVTAVQYEAFSESEKASDKVYLITDDNARDMSTFAPEMHRTVFRGRNLGTSLTNAQKAAIQSGTFTDLWLGDYWVIGGIVWRIVDFDYWLCCGNPAFEKHHLLIMPDTTLGENKQMNSTASTDGGYAGSQMCGCSNNRTQETPVFNGGLQEAQTLIGAAFGDSVLTRGEFLVNAFTNGNAVGSAWYYSTIELPDEFMVYGCAHFLPGCNGVTPPHNYTISKTQLALFMVAPRFIVARAEGEAGDSYWLRDVASSAHFALVDGYGGATAERANVSMGVRPVFPIGVA